MMEIAAPQHAENALDYTPVHGRESCPFLNFFGTSSEKIMFVAGHTLNVAVRNSLYLRNHCPSISAILSAPVRIVAIVVTAVFGAWFFFVSLAVRFPLTVAEKVGKIAKFSITKRTGEPFVEQNFSVLSLNIMGLPAFICSINSMKSCDARIRGIVDVITKQDASLVVLQECFLSVYAKKIFSLLPKSYTHMVSQVEGGNFSAPYGSGLVVISKYPLDNLSFTQYTDLLQEEKLCQKGVLSFSLTHQGQTFCLGTTHIEAAGAKQPLCARNEIALAVKKVEDTAKKFAVVTLKALIGDLNVSTTEGTYREVSPEQATCYLAVHPDKPKEGLIIRSLKDVPKGCDVRFLQEAKKTGIFPAKEPSKWFLSKNYARSAKLFSSQSDNPWQWHNLLSDRGTASSAKGRCLTRGTANIIEEGTHNSRVITLTKSPAKPLFIELFSEEVLEKYTVQERDVDQVLLAHRETIQPRVSVVGTEIDIQEWQDTVSDHRAIHFFL